MSFESDNAKHLAKLIIDQGIPHPEETIPPISISSGALGVSNTGIGKMCLDIVSKATKTKSPHYKDSYLKSTRTIIYSLIVAGFSFAHLALGTRIKPNSYLASLGLTRRHTKAITAALIESGYAIKSRGGYRHHGSSHLSKSTQYLPTEKLLTNYCELLYEPVGDFDNYEAYIFKGANRWEDGWESKALTVRKYNEFMRSFTWAQKAPTHRSLGEEPFTSGRMYTPYQNIVNRRVAIRTQTLLNGQPLVEVDFKSYHLWLLATFFGENLPNDPYLDIAEKVGCSRDAVKRLLNPLLGAKDSRQLAEIKFKLHDIDNELIDEILASLDTTLPWLKKHNLLFKAVGTKLQYVEGEVALRMFEWGVREGIPLISSRAIGCTHLMKIIKFVSVFFLLICFALFRLNSLNQKPSAPEEFSWINKVEIYVLGLALVGIAYPIYPEIAYEHLTLYWPDDGDTEVIQDDFFMESKVIKNAIQKAEQTESTIKLEWPVSSYVVSFDYDTYTEARVALAFNGGSLKLEDDKVIVSVPIKYPKRAFAPLIRVPKIGTIGVQEGLFWVLQESGWYHIKEIHWVANL